MIIDSILNRKDGKEYVPKDFYNEMMQYGVIGNGFKIAEAMDNGTEEDVKYALCRYIEKEGYNLKIFNYINSQNWLE